MATLTLTIATQVGVGGLIFHGVLSFPVRPFPSTLVFACVRARRRRWGQACRPMMEVRPLVPIPRSRIVAVVPVAWSLLIGPIHIVSASLQGLSLSMQKGVGGGRVPQIAGILPGQRVCLICRVLVVGLWQWPSAVMLGEGGEGGLGAGGRGVGREVVSPSSVSAATWQRAHGVDAIGYHP